MSFRTRAQTWIIYAVRVAQFRALAELDQKVELSASVQNARSVRRAQEFTKNFLSICERAKAALIESSDVVQALQESLVSLANR